MAIDNSLYDSLENTYNKMKDYLENTQLGPEHSPMIMQHEELAHLLERLDIEAIEEQFPDINALHAQLDAIKEVSQKIMEDLASDSTDTAGNVVSKLDTVFSEIAKLIV